MASALFIFGDHRKRGTGRRIQGRDKSGGIIYQSGVKSKSNLGKSAIHQFEQFGFEHVRAKFFGMLAHCRRIIPAIIERAHDLNEC